MRLDKFLKISCLFTTRSSAEKSITLGNVLLNNLKSKPSSNVKIGDNLTIITPFKKSNYEVLKIFEKNVSKKEAREMLSLTGEENIEF
jgi:ribosomal 50S subunit-recycling heat shock protein